MTQEEQINLINSLIIDNNIMAVTPAIAREVLIAMVMSQTPSTDVGSGFSAAHPLLYDAFTNTLRLPPIPYQGVRVKAKMDGNLQFYLEEGDIVEGWSPDGKSWWDSAVYNGGPLVEEGSFTVLVGTQITE